MHSAFRLYWATVCKTVRPMLSERYPVCPVCLSVTLVYCGQTVGWIKVPLGTEVGLGAGDIVLGGDQASPWEGAQQPPTFLSMSVVARQSPISATAELLFIYIFTNVRVCCGSTGPGVMVRWSLGLCEFKGDTFTCWRTISRLVSLKLVKRQHAVDRYMT